MAARNMYKGLAAEREDRKGLLEERRKPLILLVLGWMKGTKGEWLYSRKAKKQQKQGR
jgi:hypothetical protein